jgi:NAD(P)-dependent dehydrogenase (short-subunit alcohol dehydrogenase family)
MTNRKVAFVTGASRGIGEAIAQGLATTGYDLALFARSAEALSSVSEAIRSASGVAATPFPVDLGSEEAVHAATRAAIDLYGRCDVLVNNAAVNFRGSLNIPRSAVEQQLQVNLLGSFSMAQAVVPLMQAQGAGYIVNISSLCGKVGFAGMGGYTASKFALQGLNECLYRELVPRGIKVTAICPSWVAAPMASYAPFPQESLIQCSDIVATVLYLLNLSPGACPMEIVVGSTVDPL